MIQVSITVASVSLAVAPLCAVSYASLGRVHTQNGLSLDRVLFFIFFLCLLFSWEHMSSGDTLSVGPGTTRSLGLVGGPIVCGAVREFGDGQFTLPHQGKSA
jgi:hypothetical protein